MGHIEDGGDHKTLVVALDHEQTIGSEK